MKRWHEETHIAYRNQQNHLNSHRESNKNRGKSPDDIDCVCDHQIGRFRKMDAYDCGKAKCFICHSDKLFGYKQRQEEIADLNLNEQITEYFKL